MCGRFVGYRNLDELQKIFPIERSAYESWLNPANQDVNELKNILKQLIVTDLISYPVSKLVNSTRHNDATCIDPIEG